MSNADYKEHISVIERNKWDKCVVDLYAHIGSGGDNNHRRANGTISGFTINDYTWEEKNKLAGIQEGALNNPHPETHPYTMITGLSTVAHTGSYTNLLNIPETFKAGGGDSDTVSGIRFTIGPNPPGNPVIYKEVWFYTVNHMIYVYEPAGWIPYRAAWN